MQLLEKGRACVLSHLRKGMHACSVASIESNSVTPWTVAHQVSLSMGFSRQKYWSGLPFPPGDLPSPGVEPTSLTSALAGVFLIAASPEKGRKQELSSEESGKLT